MTAWILIAYMWSGYHGGPLAVEFDSKEACEVAAMRLAQKPMDLLNVKAICVPKGGPNASGL